MNEGQDFDASLPGPIVSSSWLMANLKASKLVLLDASLLPVVARGSPPVRTRVQIPGARIFDFDKRICDKASPLPHMMPSSELFSREVRALGISNDSVIVIYDDIGLYASPRAWWMFKAMGHDTVAVLDGGLPAWVEAGLPVQPVVQQANAPGNFVARPRQGFFCSVEQVAAALIDDRVAVVDARSPGRFCGREPEPRAGLRSGHMPNAFNLPHSTVLARGRMRPAKELKDIFSAIVQERRKLVCSCGSGVTSCILALAAVLAGYDEIMVYDGSWSEWGQPSSRPVVSG